MQRELLINVGSQLASLASDRKLDSIGVAPKLGAAFVHSLPTGLLCAAGRVLGLSWPDHVKGGNTVHVASTLRASKIFAQTNKAEIAEAIKANLPVSTR